MQAAKKDGLINFIIFLSFVIYIFGGILFILFGNIWAEENWYLARSYLVSRGELPYRDFFEQHLPLSSLIYALPVGFFGQIYILQ